MNTSNNDNENNEFKLNDDKDNENPFNDDLNSDFDFDQGEIGDKAKGVKEFFNDPIKRKYTIILSTLVLVFIAFFMLTSPDDSYDDDDFFEDNTTMIDQSDKAEDDDFENLPTGEFSENTDNNEVEAEDYDSENEKQLMDESANNNQLTSEEDSASSSLESNTQIPQLIEPKDGTSRYYDESSHRSVFSWEGGPGTIVIARSPNMKSVGVRSEVNANTFTSPSLAPGKWYWQVSNNLGSSVIRSFTIMPSPKRNISINSPKQGEKLSNGDMISWTGDKKIAYYKVELSQNGTKIYTFSTSATNYQINSVNPGSYTLKIASFSEVSGKWEYTDEISVVVQ